MEPRNLRSAIAINLYYYELDVNARVISKEDKKMIDSRLLE